MNIISTLGQQNVIPSASPSNDGQTAEEIAKEKAQKEKVDFLNLLLTQLSNQNPLDPMDTKDFSAQLTRYSILEQGIETNEKLAVTNDLLKTNATASSFSYIGNQVEVETNINSVENGKAEWSYLIEGDVSDVELTVTDANGKRIDNFEGSISKGVQSFTFNAADYGLDDGQELYLSINATNKNGDSVNHRTTSILMVDGVWTDNNQSYLTSGQLSFRTTDVLKLVEAQTNNTNATVQ